MCVPVASGFLGVTAYESLPGDEAQCRRDIVGIQVLEAVTPAKFGRKKTSKIRHDF